jgi:hypothetical protein
MLQQAIKQFFTTLAMVPSKVLSRSVVIGFILSVAADIHLFIITLCSIFFACQLQFLPFN